MNKKPSKKRTVVASAVIIFILTMMFFFITSCQPADLSGMGGVGAPDYTSTVRLPTELSVSTYIPALPSPTAFGSDAFEITGAGEQFIQSGQLDPNLVRVGVLEFQYPTELLVRSSETVVLYAYLPAQLVSADLSAFNRVGISADSPSPVIGLYSYNKITLLYEYMRVELHSTSFTIQPLQSDGPKNVNVSQPNAVTAWQWIVQAPEYPGEQVLVVSVYLGNSAEPSWVGSIRINVVGPTDTPIPTPTNTPPPPTPTITPLPSPTSTPLPFFSRMGQQVVDSISLEVCLGIPAGILALFSLIDQLRKRRVKRK